MKYLFHGQFLLLLALLLCVGLSFFMPDAFQSRATLHPLSKTLLKSTGGMGQSPGTQALAYILALLILGVMSTCVLVGVAKRGRLGAVGRWFIGGLIGYAVVFTCLFYDYSNYTRAHGTSYFGGFPTSTSWLIYGVWFFPFLLVGFFVYSFDSWYLTDEDLARFQSLLKERDKAGISGEES
jgi:hypothetical protein